MKLITRLFLPDDKPGGTVDSVPDPTAVKLLAQGFHELGPELTAFVTRAQSLREAKGWLSDPASFSEAERLRFTLDLYRALRKSVGQAGASSFIRYKNVDVPNGTPAKAIRESFDVDTREQILRAADRYRTQWRTPSLTS